MKTFKQFLAEKKFVIAIKSGNKVSGYYLADDEELVDDPRKALKYDSEKAAEVDVKMIKKSWDLEANSTVEAIVLKESSKKAPDMEFKSAGPGNWSLTDVKLWGKDGSGNDVFTGKNQRGWYFVMIVDGDGRMIANSGGKLTNDPSVVAEIADHVVSTKKTRYWSDDGLDNFSSNHFETPKRVR